MKPYVSLICLLYLLLFIQACTKKDVVGEPYPTDSLGKINRWMLDSMRRFYYWSDQIPAKPDHTQSPAQFFKGLLSNADRFSHISGPNAPVASNSYFTFGFHYAIIQVSGYDHYIGVITIVNKNGAAYQAGLKRGNYFTRVNGQQINAQNINTINQQLNNAGNIVLTPAEYNNNEWKPLPDISLAPGYSGENPVYYTRTFLRNGIKTGYLYYASFDENYDGSLLAAFSKFKQAGINELILDLRYNAGGSVASCAKLSALIASKLMASEVFAIYEGNRVEGKKSRSLQAILNTSGNAVGKQFSDLKSAQLSLSRVFILTTNATVSAAELTVNNLKPFLDVVQIGEKTMGKDEASFTITDLRIPRQVDWVLQPIVYKLFNKNGQGAYAAGLVPQYTLSETAKLPLGDVGNVDDPLIKKALELVYGADLPDGHQNLRRSGPVGVKQVYSSAVCVAEQALPVNVNAQ